MYKTMKVFDVHSCGMPTHIKECIRENYEINANGVYFEIEVCPPTFLDEADDGSEVEMVCDEYNELHKWLNESGASIGETVLILYWW